MTTNLPSGLLPGPGARRKEGGQGNGDRGMGIGEEKAEEVEQNDGGKMVEAQIQHFLSFCRGSSCLESSLHSLVPIPLSFFMGLHLALAPVMESEPRPPPLCGGTPTDLAHVSGHWPAGACQLVSGVSAADKCEDVLEKRVGGSSSRSAGGGERDGGTHGRSRRPGQ